MENNFLQIQELKKGASNVGPVKSFNLFHVNLPEVMNIFGIFMSRVIEVFCIAQVVRGVLHSSYKCLSNAMERQTHDLTVNKRLLKRHADFENTLEQLQGEDAPDNVIAEVSIFHFRTFISYIGLTRLLFIFPQFSQSMTVADKELAARILKLSDNLTLAQSQADETILILESYLKFHSMPMPMFYSMP
jgi:hypothetical protein